MINYHTKMIYLCKLYIEREREKEREKEYMYIVYVTKRINVESVECVRLFIGGITMIKTN